MKITWRGWVAFWLTIAVMFLLFGCASTERQAVAVPVTIAKPVEVKVAVPVPCVDRKDVPTLPAIPAREVLAALPDYELLLTIERVRNELAAYALKADAVLAGCVR